MKLHTALRTAATVVLAGLSVTVVAQDAPLEDASEEATALQEAPAPDAEGAASDSSESAPAAYDTIALSPPAPEPLEEEPTRGDPIDEVVVTARKREERLQDVPVSVTAVSAQALEEKQITQAKDIAAITPSLNITSDSASRSFIDIRGVGTTLIDSVQPGVGIFIDGVYAPNTSYLNSPLVDVARIEVLRGPQGTLFGQNTLGGAINVITKAPTDELSGKLSAAGADGDHYQNYALSLSGPLVDDVLRGRLGVAYHKQDGFLVNTLAGGDANPLKQETVNGSLAYEPAEIARFTLNAYFNRVFGGNVPYAIVDGPRDYTREVRTNELSLVTLEYAGANLKSEVDLAAINTTVTLVTAYDTRDGEQSGDGDFGPVDLFRTASLDTTFRTRTAELRFDTAWSETWSSLFGVFANRNVYEGVGVTNVSLIPGVLVPVGAEARNETEVFAVYGTVFWDVSDTVEVTAGMRYDYQEVIATGDIVGQIKATEWEPRVTLSKKWRDSLMTYASVSRGFRGGGANPPGAPNATYVGDSVWTYEIGTKLALFDQRLMLDAAAFYNDYEDYIGQNALAPGPGGVGVIAINLNTGTVRSPGVEAAMTARLTPHWSATLGGSYIHARVTDGSGYEEVTGKPLPSDRILFLADWSGFASTSYWWELFGNRLIVDGGLTYKGERNGSTTDPESIPKMQAYTLFNASLTYRAANWEVALYGSNLTDEDYFQTYIDKSLLEDALGPIALIPGLANNLGIVGDGRRVGARLGFYF